MPQSCTSLDRARVHCAYTGPHRDHPSWPKLPRRNLQAPAGVVAHDAHILIRNAARPVRLPRSRRTSAAGREGAPPARGAWHPTSIVRLLDRLPWSWRPNEGFVEGAWIGQCHTVPGLLLRQQRISMTAASGSGSIDARHWEPLSAVALPCPASPGPAWPHLGCAPLFHLTSSAQPTTMSLLVRVRQVACWRTGLAGPRGECF